MLIKLLPLLEYYLETDTQQWIVAIQFHSNFFPSGIKDLSPFLCREVPQSIFPSPQPMWASPQACGDVKVNQGQGDALDSLQRKTPKDTQIDTDFLLLWSTFAFLVHPIKTPSLGPFGFPGGPSWNHLQTPMVGWEKTPTFCVSFQPVEMQGGGEKWRVWKTPRPRHILLWTAYSAAKASCRLFWIASCESIKEKRDRHRTHFLCLHLNHSTEMPQLRAALAPAWQWLHCTDLPLGQRDFSGLILEAETPYPTADI